MTGFSWAPAATTLASSQYFLICPPLPLERYCREVRDGLTHSPSGDLAPQAVDRNAIEGLSKYTESEKRLAEESNE